MQYLSLIYFTDLQECMFCLMFTHSLSKCDKVNLTKLDSYIHLIIDSLDNRQVHLPNRCWPLRGWKTRPKEDGQIGTNQSLPLERGALFNRFFGKPAHGPPHVAGGASGPIWGCRDESRTDNPDLDLRHVFDRHNQKTDLI